MWILKVLEGCVSEGVWACFYYFFIADSLVSVDMILKRASVSILGSHQSGLAIT